MTFHILLSCLSLPARLWRACPPLEGYPVKDLTMANGYLGCSNLYAHEIPDIHLFSKRVIPPVRKDGGNVVFYAPQKLRKYKKGNHE